MILLGLIGTYNYASDLWRKKQSDYRQHPSNCRVTRPDKARHLGYKAMKVLDDSFFKYETKPKLTSLASSITKGDEVRIRCWSIQALLMIFQQMYGKRLGSLATTFSVSSSDFSSLKQFYNIVVVVLFHDDFVVPLEGIVDTAALLFAGLHVQTQELSLRAGAET
ncbi:hypothetical protein MKW92_028422 [Papaver armeniacum]|nr:hypothetical protein MKW92_028422 [Papaver armeniacum]